MEGWAPQGSPAPAWSVLGALCGSLVVRRCRVELVLAQSWSIPFLSFPQCVPENAAAALGLDCNDLLVSNKNNLCGLLVCPLTDQGHHSEFQEWWGKGVAWPLTGALQFVPTPSKLCLLLWLWDPHPPASTPGAGAASAMATCPFAAVVEAQNISIFLLFLFITAGVKGLWGC